MIAVELTNVALEYTPGKRVIMGLNAVIREGEFVALIAPNGIGKSTIIRMLSGGLAPSEGMARVYGHPVTNLKTLYDYVGILHQSAPLPDYLTVWEYLSGEATIRGVPKDRLLRRIEEAELEPFRDKRLKTLSKGSQRKVALVKAILHDPRILLLDEPTTGLDVSVRHWFFHYLKGEKAKGLTCLLATHHLEEVSSLCEKALIFMPERAEWECIDLSAARSGGRTVLLYFQQPLRPSDIETLEQLKEGRDQVQIRLTRELNRIEFLNIRDVKRFMVSMTLTLGSIDPDLSALHVQSFTN